MFSTRLFNIKLPSLITVLHKLSYIHVFVIKILHVKPPKTKRNHFLYFKSRKHKKEVGEDLGVCVPNLQIAQGKSKSLDHVIKGSCDFMGGTSSLYVTTLPGFVAVGIVVVEIKNVFNLSCDLT